MLVRTISLLNRRLSRDVEKQNGASVSIIVPIIENFQYSLSICNSAYYKFYLSLTLCWVNYWVVQWIFVSSWDAVIASFFFLRNTDGSFALLIVGYLCVEIGDAFYAASSTSGLYVLEFLWLIKLQRVTQSQITSLSAIPQHPTKTCIRIILVDIDSTLSTFQHRIFRDFLKSSNHFARRQF